MIDIALYQPDIHQNTAAIIRLGACLRLKVHIIEPCSFSLEDKRFKRVVMDYDKFTKIFKYGNFLDFKEKNSKSRIILLTTKATKNYLNFKFKKNDILLFGRESAGVPESIHIDTKVKIKIPLQKKVRSLNVAMSVAIASSEAIRQLENK